MATSVTLPACVLSSSGLRSESPVHLGGISSWLDGLRPGWAARFAPAFDRLGLTVPAQAAILEGADMEALEEELRRQGAKLVQLKQLRRALADVFHEDKEENLDSSRKSMKSVRICAADFQSPMAAYFGEISRLNIANAKTCRKLTENYGIRKSVSICESPQANQSPIGCSPTTLAGEQIQGSNNKVCKESGLPFKSPMAAYFDGDDIDAFYVPTSLNTITPATFVFCIDSSEALEVAPLDTACQLKAELSEAEIMAPEPTERTTTAAPVDEQTQKARLKLAELLILSDSAAAPLAQRVWQLSQDSQGTFEVQRALEACRSDEERFALAAELRGHVYEAMMCPHANHVIKQVVTSLPASSLNFTVSELMGAGPSAIIEVSRHRYGCRIMEQLLSHAATSNLAGIVDIILADATSLSTHMYGNFVIQRLLEHAVPAQRFFLMQLVSSNLAAIAVNFYGAAVVGKAIAHGTSLERLALARQFLSVKGLLSAFARKRHGKPNVPLLFSALEGAERQEAMCRLSDMPLKMPCKTSRPR